MRLKRRFRAAVVVICILLAASLGSPVAAQGTTVEELLTWERSAQDGFIQISVSMVGTVATQVRPKMADCIDDWYFVDPTVQGEEHDKILSVMTEYREFDPTAFMLAYIESLCGKISE